MFGIRTAGLVMVLAMTVAAARALNAPASVPASSAASAAGPTSLGAELFSVHCARCHGPRAAGSPNGPDLRRRTQGMSEEAFVNAVLRRYRWTVPAAQAGGESAGREAMLQATVTTRRAEEMPAWESSPAVVLGVKDLYAYVRAQAR